MSSTNKLGIDEINCLDTDGKSKPRSPSSFSEKTITRPEKETGTRHFSLLKSNLPKLIPLKREDLDPRAPQKTSPVRERIFKTKARYDRKPYRMNEEEKMRAARKKAMEDFKMKREILDKIKESKKLKVTGKGSSTETEDETDSKLEKTSSNSESIKEKMSKTSNKVGAEEEEQFDEEEDSNLDFQSCLGVEENSMLSMEGESKKGSEEGWQERQNLIVTDLINIMKDMREPKFDKMLWMNKTTLTNSMLKGKLELRSKKLMSQQEPVNVIEPKYVQDFYDQALKEISDVWLNTSSIISAVKDHSQKFFGKKNKNIDKEQLVLEAEMLQLAIDFAIHFSRLRTDFLLKKVKNRLQVKELKKGDLEMFMESKTLAALYNEEDLSGMARTIKDLSASIWG